MRQTLADIANTLEDIRMENVLAYRNSRPRKAVVEEQICENDPPAHMVQGYLFYELRRTVLGQNRFNEKASFAGAMLDTKMPGLREKIDMQTQGIRTAKSIADIDDMAAEIWQILKQEVSKNSAGFCDK